MKKNITLFIAVFFTYFSYSQGGGAYSQLKSPDNSISNSLQNIAKQQQQRNLEKRLYLERTQYTRSKNFNYYRDLALDSYKNLDFAKCISNYYSSTNYGFHDSHLEYVTGISYYHFYTKTKENKYKRKAKKILKLSKKHGNIQAELFLDENFK